VQGGGNNVVHQKIANGRLDYPTPYARLDFTVETCFTTQVMFVMELTDLSCRRGYFM
jgi:hypothetical protein